MDIENSSYIRSIFIRNGEKLKFKIGQSISDDNYLSGSVYFIEEGSARVIYKQENKFKTIKKISKGACVGAISLIRSSACENIRASTELLAYKISDQDFKNFYQKDLKFKEFFDSNIFESEIIHFANHLTGKLINNQKGLLDLFSELKTSFQTLFCNSKEINDLIKSENRKLYLAQKLEGFELYFLIDNQNKANSIFNDLDDKNKIRFISIDLNLITENIKDVESINISEKEDASNADIKSAPSKAPLSVFNNAEFSEDILVKANGLVRETLACFQMISRILEIPIRKDSLEKILRDIESRGAEIDLKLVGDLFSNLGLNVTNGTIPPKMACRLQTPCIIKWNESFAIILKSSQEGIVLASPNEGFINIPSDNLEKIFKSSQEDILLASPNEGSINIPIDILEKSFKDEINILLLEKTNETPQKIFNLNWFWPAIQKYKVVLIQVLIASFVVQLFTLGNPLLIQVIIDKVISQRSLDTLQVLGVALLFVTLLEGILGSLRTFLFAETTNRIDQRLGSEVIDHLLRLPLNYFDKRPVGELGSRVDELEKIREFLTGQALSTILDAIFSVIYIVVMFIYSSLLTLIALVVVPIQIAITLLGAPLFRRQFRQAAEENAKTKSHLVEVLTSIQTVKSQNIETISRWKWQKLYSKYISRTFERTISGTTIGQISQVLQKISQLLVLWVGATLVLKGQLTLGQLIAFRIISSYVTQPLLRLSTIWQNIQELRVSFERLGDVIDTPQESTELDKQQISMPPVKGNVGFEDVTFSFDKTKSNVLDKVSFEIDKGQFVGIVGESGSGKSTLMKLLSRLYSPNQGKIKIDGYDIDKVELYSLRRQIGIVPQEPILFSGTVMENIALTQSEATNDEIIKAAKLAEAHEFIMNLPNGYSTNVGERGSSLSGGQRQRIAIARTLLNKPQILILDEATSALDYNTEKKLCDNLIDNLKDNTVFFITHRLATIKNSDQIIVMHNGKLDEMGSYQKLMSNKGRYFALESQQGNIG